MGCRRAQGGLRGGGCRHCLRRGGRSLQIRGGHQRRGLPRRGRRHREKGRHQSGSRGYMLQYRLGVGTGVL